MGRRMEGAEHTNQAGFSRLAAKGSTPFSLTNKTTRKMRLDERCEIRVTFGTITRMEREGCGSRPTIRKALNGTYNANNPEERERALRIRQRAYELGGCLVGAEVPDEMEA